MELNETLKRVLALGLYDKMTTPKLPENIDQYVAAGNPRKQMADFPSYFPLPAMVEVGGENVPLNKMHLLIVSGNSMSPEGILNGDEVLLSKVQVCDVSYGDYIVIMVDPEFYQHRHHGKRPHFKSKLRKALMTVTKDMTIEQICDILSKRHNEYLSESEKDDMSDSLKEARDFYEETPLFLSVTYHDGNIHYSFHPQENIQYRVNVVARQTQQEIVFLSPDNLFN